MCLVNANYYNTYLYFCILNLYTFVWNWSLKSIRRIPTVSLLLKFFNHFMLNFKNNVKLPFSDLYFSRNKIYLIPNKRNNAKRPM